MITIRKATHDDVSQLVALAFCEHQESRLNIYHFDFQKVATLIFNQIDSNGPVLVAEDTEVEFVPGQNIIGGFVGGYNEHFFGTEVVAFDYGLFVIPEYRGRSVGYQLVKAYVNVAKQHGASEIIISNSTDITHEEVARLYEKCGFRKVGYSLTMDVKGGV